MFEEIHRRVEGGGGYGGIGFSKRDEIDQKVMRDVEVYLREKEEHNKAWLRERNTKFDRREEAFEKLLEMKIFGEVVLKVREREGG